MDDVGKFANLTEYPSFMAVVEEKALNARFGEEFAQSCGDVRYRLIPGVF